MEELNNSSLSAEPSGGKSTGNMAYLLCLIGLLLLAFALRIFKLDEQSIWWDEGISLHLAVSPIADILSDRLSNIHPPLYFIFLKGWLSTVGVSTFGARYLSVLASWLQVAAIYGIARRWFSRRTAVVALLVAALSAVSIIYGQETRVYALLALIYLLLLAVTRELTLPQPKERKMRASLWLTLGLTTWFGLHLHYIVLFVVGYVSAWALIVFVRQRRWADLRRWVFVLALVGLSSLPWFLAVLSNWMNVQGEAFAGTFGTDPAPISFLLAQVWTFHLTGLAGSLARQGVGLLAALSAAVLIVLVLIRLWQERTRRDTAVLLAHWLIPLSSALVVWTVRSFSHPRYVSMFAPGLIILVAYTAYPPKEQLDRRLKTLAKLLSVILLAGILVSSLLGLWLYFVDPEVAKDDIRGVARYLEVKAEVGDLILIPDTDWSLLFEYQGEVNVSMPGLDDPESKWTNLAGLTSDVHRVFLVDYKNGTRDWQGVLPFAFGKAGSIESETTFDGLVVQSFILNESISAPEIRSDDVNFSPLELTGSFVEADEHAGEALTIALRWQLSESTGQNAHVSLRLIDEAGWSLATTDTKLLDAHGRPPSKWTVGEPVTTYHVLTVPPAVPSLDHDLEIQLYVADEQELNHLSIVDDQGAPKGQSYIIGKSHLSYDQDAQEAAQDDLLISPWSKSLLIAPDLVLLAADPETDTALPGELLHIQLLWQAAGDYMPDYRPELALVQGDQDLVVNQEVPVYGRYPTQEWASGQQVFERRGLLVPLDASGEASVVLRLGEDQYVLDEVEIEARDHNFAQPSADYAMDITFDDTARITGFDLAKTTVKDGEAIQMSLVWESLLDGSEVDYVVFTHLLADDGHLIAQHDGRPDSGNRPTTGWRKGEYIIDAHGLSFNEVGYRGQARIEIGLYDPVSGERLMLSDGSDFLILPVTLTIENP